MSNGVHLEIQPAKGPGGRPVCHVELDGSHAGRRVTFSLVRKVSVKDHRAIDKEDLLFSHDFRAEVGRRESFELPGEDAAIYSYRGPHMDIQLLCRIVVDDGFLWDTTVEEAVQADPFPHPRTGACARHLADPEDQYRFFENLQALPPGRRLLAGTVAALGIGGLAANGFVTLHDMITPSREAFFYPPDAGPTLMMSLFLTFLGGTLVYATLKKLMGGYVSLAPARLAGPLGREDQVRVGDLFRAEALTDLSGLRVRVIACNQEKGQYRRGSGTNTRTVSFSHPTRGVVLLDRTLGVLRRGTEVHLELRDPLDLTPMFDGLYPPQMVGAHHGMNVHFEIQLMHDDLIDRELVLPPETFDWHAFLDDGDASRG